MALNVAEFIALQGRRDAAWQAEHLARVPEPWQERAAGMLADRIAEAREIPAGTGRRGNAERLANTWLTQLAERFGGLRVSPGLSDGDLCELADHLAGKALSICDSLIVRDSSAVRSRLAAWVQGYGITPPALPYTTRTGKQAGIADGPAIARMLDAMWWRRGLRRAQARALEGHAIALGFVHRRGEIYASDATVERRTAQRKRNAAALERVQAINKDTGDIYTLAELAARSVANPRIRRGELMTRIAGFEAIAKGLKHAAEFVTLTCPSAWHAKKTKDGAVFDNPRWNGKTPREAQGYLARVWANIRAKLFRLGVRPYGFRIAEPHHDGTPHWHLLLFVEAHLVEPLRVVVRDYALRVDGDEPGAQKNRVEFVSIDPARGSAAGYVAKYVSKNIDGGGYEVQGDIEGMDSVTTSPRVEAWASAWGIRQFQQVGGPPVGVWRELRRLDSVGAYSNAVEAARIAADCGSKNGHSPEGAAGNWRRYVEIQGGPQVGRDDLALRVAMTREGERWDYQGQQPYPAERTRYGEVAKPVPFGVLDVAKDRAFASVRYRWEIKRKGADRLASADGRPAGDQRFGALAFDVGRTAKPAGPWTRVNNCSRGNDGRGDQSIAGAVGAGEIGCQDGANGADLPEGGGGRGFGGSPNRSTGGDCRGVV